MTELKNLMDDVFASIVSGVITADVQDQTTLCNRAAASILGNTSAEIVGRKIEDILPTLASDILPHLDTVRKTEQPIVGLEISYKVPERGIVDWRFNISPLKDAEQKTQGVAIVLDDMTEQKKLEAQRSLLQRMVSPAVLDQIDPNSLQIGGKRGDITILFADIRNRESATLVGVPNTPYRAFQAVTEYADHYRPLRVADAELVPARRFTTAIDGPAGTLKQDAMRLLREEFEIR